MTEKRFDFKYEYITLDGGVFATAKNRQDAELISRTLNQLYDESEQLKHRIKKLQNDLNNYSEIFNELNALVDENEKLKQRNTNQYNQLTELWEIIEEENWEKLITMKKQLKEDEERLQQEWKCYE